MDGRASAMGRQCGTVTLGAERKRRVLGLGLSVAGGDILWVFAFFLLPPPPFFLRSAFHGDGGHDDANDSALPTH